MTLAKRLTPCRNSLIEFTKQTHPKYIVGDVHRLIAGKLEEVARGVERGEPKKLMIFVRPRVGKTELASIRFPAWFIGRNPNTQIIQSSYGQDLSNKFSRHTRALIASREYGLIFPGVNLNPEAKSVKEWEVIDDQYGMGSYRAAGAGAGITGMGAHVLIVDDPVKDAEEAESERVQQARYDWYISTARSRLMPGGSEIIIMTRWNMYDLAGRLLEEEDDWEVLSIPFRAVSDDDPLGRKPGEFLDDGRYSMEDCQKIWDSYEGSPRKRYVRNALYQQNPQPLEGMPFPSVNRCRYRMDDAFARDHTVYVIADIAESKDRRRDTTGVVVGGIDYVGTLRASYAEEIQEKPKLRNDRLFEIMRQARALGCHTLHLEGDRDVINGLQERMRIEGFDFGIEPLKHKGRAKEARILEIDDKMHRLEIGPEAEILAQRLTAWSPVSGTPDDLPDALAYFCEVAQYDPNRSDDWKPPRPTNPLAATVYDATFHESDDFDAPEPI